MLNERIIRDYSVSIYIENLNKIHKTKAIFNQADRKSSVLIVQLLNNKNEKKPINVTGCTIVAKILKNDGTTSDILCAKLDEENGFIAVGLTEQALLTVGENIIELQIQYGNQLMHSPKMSYTVVDNLYDESELLRSQEEFPVLNSLILEVQELQKNLLNLNSLVNNSENERNTNESGRTAAESNRELNFNNMKENHEQKINEINKKVTEVNSAINDIKLNFKNETDKINEAVDAKKAEVDNKISEINSKIVEINETIQANVDRVENCIEGYNNKILEVNNLIETSKQNFNMIETNINKKVDEYDLEYTKTIEKLTNQTQGVIDNLQTSVNDKILEVDKKMQVVDTTNSHNTSNINAKISECNDLISNTNSLNESFADNENLRNNNETNRQNTFNAIVSELEVTQSDIDDILGMIGGI